MAVKQQDWKSFLSMEHEILMTPDILLDSETPKISFDLQIQARFSWVDLA